MPQKTWFFEGSTFVSPEFKQSGKPYQINRAIQKLYVDNLPKPKTLTEKLKAWFIPDTETNGSSTAKHTHVKHNRLAQQYNDDPSVYE